jgi:hypothetical protein
MAFGGNNGGEVAELCVDCAWSLVGASAAAAACCARRRESLERRTAFVLGEEDSGGCQRACVARQTKRHCGNGLFVNPRMGVGSSARHISVCR